VEVHSRLACWTANREVQHSNPC